MSHMIPKLITALQNANLNMTAEEFAEALWLSLHISEESGEEVVTSIEQDVKASPADSQRESATPPAQSEVASELHLHSQRQVDESTSQQTGLLFRSPAATALPRSLALARALRPLKRRLPSRTKTVLNEQATVQRIAETHAKIWAPVLEPALTPWFEIALVIDEGASMMLWRQTIAELRILLERLGAFRDVRVWRLDTDNLADVRLYVEPNSVTTQRQARTPKELIDPTGRRLILVVTDCISPAWHSGKVQGMLELWGQKNAVTLIQMLPRRLWSRTTLCTAELVRVRASAPGVANAQLKLPKSSQSIAGQAIPIPVVTLEQGSLANWAHMLMGENNLVSSALFDTNSTDMLSKSLISNQDDVFLTPQERVHRFRTTASPIARKLAGFLATAPISLPVVRLIQQTLLPESGQLHVAEIFLSGLLEVVYRDEHLNDPDYIEYDFLPGVRDELLNSVPIPDLLEVSVFIGSHYGLSRDFYARAALPLSLEEPTAEAFPITKASRPFARIAAKVWRRLGGEFAHLADHLEQQEDKNDTQFDTGIGETSDIQEITFNEDEKKEQASTSPTSKILPIEVSEIALNTKEKPIVDNSLLLARSRVALEGGQSYSARQVLEQIHPENTEQQQEVDYLRAWSYVLEAYWEEAESILSSLISIVEAVEEIEYGSGYKRQRHAFCLFYLGDVAANLGHYEDASLHYTKCLRLLRDRRVQSPKAQVIHIKARYSLAMTFLMRGSYTAAKQHYDDAFKLYNSVSESCQYDLRGDLAAIYYGFCTLYWRTGNLLDAFEMGNKALNLYKEIGERLMVGHMHNQLGHIYMLLGELREASEHFTDALALATANDQLKMIMLNGTALAQLRVSEGRLQDAMDYCQLALEFMSRSRDDQLTGLAYLTTGKVVQAEADSLQGEQKQRRLSDALQYFEQSCHFLDKTQAYGIIAEAYGKRAEVLEVLGRVQEAVDCWRNAYKVLRNVT